MSDDAVLMQGRQTKRKWKTILGLTCTSLVLLAGARAAAHPQALLDSAQTFAARIFSRNTGQWIATDHGPETCAFLVNDSVFFAEAGSISALDEDGRTVFRETTQLSSPQAVHSRQAAVVFDSCGGELLLINNQGSKTLEIPLGVDAAAVSDLGSTAVITAGSGYQTLTCCFDAQGTLLREIGLSQEAMVLMTYLRGSDVLSACVITAEGKWHLRFYEEDTCTDIPLNTSEVYEMKPCGEGVALWTCDGICLISEKGEITAELPVTPDELLLWDSDGFAAAVILEAGSPILVTLDAEGAFSRSQPLTRTPRDLSVCASRCCVLDREALLIYDKHCRLKDSAPEGAFAASIQAIPGGAAIFGDREFMRYISK